MILAVVGGCPITLGEYWRQQKLCSFHPALQCQNSQNKPALSLCGETLLLPPGNATAIYLGTLIQGPHTEPFYIDINSPQTLNSQITSTSFSTILTSLLPYPIHKRMAPNAMQPQDGWVLSQQKQPQPQELVDIRTLPATERHTLIKGRRIEIYRGRGDEDYIADVPVRIIQRASRISNKLLSNINAGIHLPFDTDKQAVADFLQYLVYLGKTEEEPQLMAQTNSIYRDLCICGASYLLGLQKYTENIYTFYWDHFTESIPTYDEIWAIMNLPASMDKNAKMFNKIARSLAVLVRDKTIPDPDDFTAYLENDNHRLRDAIFEINKAHAYRVNKDAERAERQRKLEEEERMRKEAAEQRAKKMEEKRIREKVLFDGLKARDAALERAIQEKMKKAGQMFTPDETKHWVRTRGTRPPKGR
jgi:hypothetical protein